MAATSIGRRVWWTEEDGTRVEGSIVHERSEYHAGLDMELTHVTIEWCDGQEPTRHTLESLAKDPRVKFKN